ncbi:MAG: hypothetical protein AAF434_16250 [Pseudomonadota bacterium]
MAKRSSKENGRTKAQIQKKRSAQCIRRTIEIQPLRESGALMFVNDTDSGSTLRIVELNQPA